jgi:hypothetical protein
MMNKDNKSFNYTKYQYNKESKNFRLAIILGNLVNIIYYIINYQETILKISVPSAIPEIEAAAIHFKFLYLSF